MDRPTLNLIKRAVVVEPAPEGNGWLVMDWRGQVLWRRTPEIVVAMIQKWDRERVRRTTGLDGCVTRIEWRNVPEGFVPPTIEVR